MRLLRRLPTRHYTSKVVSGAEKPRINELGIQYLSESLHKKVFPKTSVNDYKKKRDPARLLLAQKHLKHNGLLDRKTNIEEPIQFPHFPSLVGNNIEEHFHKLGTLCSEPYLSMAERFLATKTLPKKPTKWVFESGWTRYTPGADPEAVPFPSESELVFDVEVMYHRSPFAVICTAVSSKAWYGWVSPLLTNFAIDPSYDDWEHLIPFDCLRNPKLLVGYNVSYDRARVREEYNIKQSQAFYLDGMALHVATSGISSQQRPMWHKHNKAKKTTEEELELFVQSELDQELSDDPWLNKGSPNSLASVAKFHCGIDVDKSDREFFETTEPQDIIDNFDMLMDYCAKDVDATFKITAELFPRFRKKIPHPVSFAALRHLGTLVLPTTKKWDSYVLTAEDCYLHNRQQVSEILRERANSLVSFVEAKEPLPDVSDDPWLRQLDWTLKEQRFKKNGEPVAKQAFLTGYPEWYRDLFRNKEKEMNISVRTRITPLLLKLKWEGYPLLWTDSAGWCFKVPDETKEVKRMAAKNYTLAKLSEEDHESLLDELRDNGHYQLFKIPHPEGPSKRCTSVLSKSYLRYFENGVLSSEYEYAQDILRLNSEASYWMGNRNRILDQFVVYSDTSGSKNMFFDTKVKSREHPEMGIILPKLCSMGTITRRATENTWLTASNSKSNRIGSELKAMIEAPQGYAFVGADVDSEELWIASLVGDSMFKIHGGTALGWMTLEGDKNEGTDLHSKTAEILGILRNDAKVFNYGRIYGAGVKFATTLLKQFNSELTDAAALKVAQDLYARTKGQTGKSKFLDRPMYHGGTESVMFNALEAIAYQDDPRTPVLGAAITDALSKKNLNKNNYMTSRINWAIQSSGVDYLHLLLISMEYLIARYQVDARLILTVHDEIRYMVKEDQKYKLALLLQVSNLWTRAMFCEQMGLKEVPQSCAFFSEVDIDHVLRKEVTMDCVTPSHPDSIPPGEKYTIRQLLEKCDFGKVLDEGRKKRGYKPLDYQYQPQVPVLQALQGGIESLSLAKLRIQNSIDKAEWRKEVNQFIKLQKNEQLDEIERSFEKTSILSKPRKSIKNDFDVSSDGDEALRHELAALALESYDDQNHDFGDFSIPGQQVKYVRRSAFKYNNYKPQKYDIRTKTWSAKVSRAQKNIKEPKSTPNENRQVLGFHPFAKQRYEAKRSFSTATKTARSVTDRRRGNAWFYWKEAWRRPNQQ